MMLSLEKKSHKIVASNFLTHHKWKRGTCELPQMVNCELSQTGNCEFSANRLIFSICYSKLMYIFCEWFLVCEQSFIDKIMALIYWAALTGYRGHTLHIQIP